MLLRALTLATWIAAVSPAQGPAPTRVPEVLAVLDTERLDGPSFQALIDSAEDAVPALVAACSAPTPDDALATRRRTRALRALRAIGPAARAAALPLIEVLRSSERSDVPALLDTLSETAGLAPDPGELLGAATAAFSPFVTPGDAGFLDRLKGSIRLHMRLSHPLPLDDIDALSAALEHADPYVRELSCDRLGALGPAARAALDGLERTMNATDHPRRAALPNHSLGTDFGPMISDAAAVAIARIAPQDPRAHAGLRSLLVADSPRDRIEAAMAIGRSGDRQAENDLIRALDDDDPRLVAEAVTALGMIDASSPRTVGALRGLLDHGNPGVVARARAALKRAGIETPARR